MHITNEKTSQNPRRVAHCRVSSLVMVCRGFCEVFSLVQVLVHTLPGMKPDSSGSGPSLLY